jgi:hypothetical protein
MKATAYRNISVLIAVLFSGSCLDYTVTTSVNRDGSIYRMYEVRGDSVSVFGGSLLVPSGPDWNISHEYTYKERDDTLSEKSQYMYKASRTFSDVHELNHWIESDTSWQTIKPKVSLVRRFRWFYTYFDYKEKYPMSFPFKNLPVDSFLTEKEQSIIMDDDRVVYSPKDKELVWKKNAASFTYSHSDSLEMKRISDYCQKRLDQWMGASMVQEYLDILNSHFGGDSAARMITRKAAIFRETMTWKFDIMSMDSISVGLLAVTADSLISSSRLQALCKAHPEVFGVFDLKFREIEKVVTMDSYRQYLSLPGTVYATNAEDAGASRITWIFDSDSFFMTDYEMRASSRMPNRWIMVITALIALILVLMLIFMKRK